MTRIHQTVIPPIMTCDGGASRGVQERMSEIGIRVIRKEQKMCLVFEQEPNSKKVALLKKKMSTHIYYTILYTYLATSCHKINTYCIIYE